MKKISSIHGGRFCIYCFIISILISVIAIVIALFSDLSSEAIYAFILPLLLLFVTIHFIKNGFLSYLEICHSKISNKENSLDWENVYITAAIVSNSVYGRAPVVIMCIDDHYLIDDDINNKKYKMFMIVTPRMPQRQECILSNYNKKVQIINKWQDERLKVFLEHNKQFD